MHEVPPQIREKQCTAIKINPISIKISAHKGRSASICRCHRKTFNSIVTLYFPALRAAVFLHPFYGQDDGYLGITLMYVQTKLYPCRMVAICTAQGFFAAGILAVRSSCRTEFSPYGVFVVRKFRRTVFSPYEYQVYTCLGSSSLVNVFSILKKL